MPRSSGSGDALSADAAKMVASMLDRRSHCEAGVSRDPNSVIPIRWFASASSPKARAGCGGPARRDPWRRRGRPRSLLRQPEEGWHTLRHTFGPHAALFGVNPWRLMTWLGHKSLTETFRYVHTGQAHMREVPREVVEAAAGETDPDRRILKMLGARKAANSRHPDGTEDKKQRGKCILKLVK